MDSSDESFGFYQQNHENENCNGKNGGLDENGKNGGLDENGKSGGLDENGKNGGLDENATGGKKFVHGCMSSYDNGLPEDSAIYKILHNTFRLPRNPFLPPVDYSRQPRKTGVKKGKGPEEGPDDDPNFGIISDKEKRYLDLLQTHNKKWRYFDIPDEEKSLYDEFMKLAQEITSQEKGFMAHYVARYMKSTEEWQKNYLKRRDKSSGCSSSHN